MLIKTEDVKIENVWDDDAEQIKIDNFRDDEDSTKGIKLKWRDSDYICPDCNKKFKNPRTFRSHRSNDCGKSYFCQKCSKKFTYRASFLRHKKRC